MGSGGLLGWWTLGELGRCFPWRDYDTLLTFQHTLTSASLPTSCSWVISSVLIRNLVSQMFSWVLWIALVNLFSRRTESWRLLISSQSVRGTSNNLDLGLASKLGQDKGSLVGLGVSPAGSEALLRETIQQCRRIACCREKAPTGGQEGQSECCL